MMIPTGFCLSRVLERVLQAGTSLLAFLVPPARPPVLVRIAPAGG